MTLQEAIESAKQEILNRPLPHEEAYNNALKLLIEAGERIITARRWEAAPWNSLLLWETKEKERGTNDTARSY